LFEGWILLVQLPGWRPTVWLGFAAVLALAPELALVLLGVPVLGARPLLGLLRPVWLRWPLRSERVWSVE
jgi:hypothetical protein